ncbi:fused response regulator/phosphatase [Zooshikella marina]|uniref:Response regulator n=1 Tax=Zooshikella ganghwensis TaxID=202772 RepID=A0A4P9VNA0_9GAMM|nr:fused response regulator/phosphatase [Zooshikella ganghwensis]MBU2706829.1 fused response regulator/phosphatase [Zooshikella ganghwensis]RDH43580.1 response regulator [Zooshikella ganghwensis]
MELAEGSIKILVADDSETDRMILRSLVLKQGHRVVTAEDGQQAVELFILERPQLVLLDVLMPVMSGYEAARQIKQLAGEELVPVIFLTSLKDAQSLAECLDAGGDDFLSKPYSPLILQAKINAFNRMRMMHHTLQVQRDKIAGHNKRLLQEQAFAKEIFDKVAHSGCLNAHNLQHLQSPYAMFNGDVLIAARKPSGGMLVFLGDFAGHGLPAAIGAMPLAEIFYHMVAKGFSMPEILSEVNSKMKQVLPVSGFCCGGMVDIDFDSKVMKVWIGGLPDCYLYRTKTKTLDVLTSKWLPLGILSADKFDTGYEIIEVDYDDRLYLWSDGVIEAQDDQQHFFGEERLKAVFTNNEEPDQLFNEIKESVFSFIGEPTDDLSMIEISMVPRDSFSDKPVPVEASTIRGARNWSASFEFRPETLQSYNPIPLILHCLMQVPGVNLHSGRLYTILAELYSNALEHGVLGMDSSLKASLHGFTQYYAEREHRLQQLKEGFIRFWLEHKIEPQGGVLVITVADSGPGFNYQKMMNRITEDTNYHGRGVNLLRSFCRRVEYSEVGNQVTIEYAWNNELDSAHKGHH